MRIGIVGSDNTHALGFAKVANGAFGASRDVRVVALCGADPEATRAVAAEGRIDEVVDSPKEMADRVDAAIVVDRHGGLHLEHSQPFLEAGLPVLVDKPLATTLDEARAILALGHHHNAPVTSYSSLRWCRDVRELVAGLPDIGRPVTVQSSGLCDFASPYGGQFFYGIHEVEIALALHPARPVAVRADASGPVRTARIETEDGCLLILTLIGSTDGALPNVPFHAACFGAAGRVGRVIRNEPDLSAALEKFLDLVSTGVAPVTDEQMLTSIAVLEAIGQSADQGGAAVDVADVR